MLLTLDIGNTNIKAGVFDGHALIARWRLATNRRFTADDYALEMHNLLSMRRLTPSSIDAVAMCSVVPPLTGLLQEMARDLFHLEPLVLHAGLKTGVRILYDDPRQLGADRLAGAAGAYHLYGGPLLIVDFGTATKFEAITASGDYLGGAIAPGLQVAGESLFTSTSQLRRVDFTPPRTAIGKNVSHSIQSGLMLGYVGLVESMVERMKRELAAPNATVIATGGLAEIMASETAAISQVEPDLTLKGLQYIYGLNT